MLYRRLRQDLNFIHSDYFNLIRQVLTPASVSGGKDLPVSAGVCAPAEMPRSGNKVISCAHRGHAQGAKADCAYPERLISIVSFLAGIMRSGVFASGKRCLSAGNPHLLYQTSFHCPAKVWLYVRLSCQVPSAKGLIL